MNYPNNRPTIDYHGYFTGALDRLHGERRYRVFADLERIAGRFPHAIWHSPDGPKNVVIWCSNDYLGMGQHPKVIGAMVETATRMGTGAGGTRNIAGNNHPLVELERELADLHRKEAALVFTSGYVSNETGISTLARLMPNCLILSDAWNHNSMIEGVRQAHCEKQIFRHNDMAHLEELLAAADPERPKLIVFESLYSMDGDVAPVNAHLRPRRALRRDDLYRRGACGRHVRSARRRHQRARRRHRPHRRDRGHARQGVRLPRRLHRRLDRADRRGALLCARLHLHHRAAAVGLRGGDRRDPASEDLAMGARTASGSRRAHQGGAGRRGAAGHDQPDAHRAGLLSAIRNAARRRATSCSPITASTFSRSIIRPCPRAPSGCASRRAPITTTG